ncbi:phage tail tape measure tp901 core region, partial [Lasius niger]
MADEKVGLLYAKRWILKHKGLWNRFPVRLEKLPIRDSDPRSSISMLHTKRWIMEHEDLWNKFPVQLEELPDQDSDDYNILKLSRWLEDTQDELLARLMD